jgi:hypothetical protein
MSWSHQIHDIRFELAGVDSNNDAIFLTKDYSVVSQKNKSMYFDETSRLALLSMTEVVLSFGSVVFRWNHSHYNRRRGKLKRISYSNSDYIFRRRLHVIIITYYLFILSPSLLNPHPNF